MNNEVREIIELSAWKDGCGWQYTETLEDHIINAAATNEDYDWSWWEPVSLPEDEDLRITVKHYPTDCDLLFDDIEPIASFEVWQSDIINDR